MTYRVILYMQGSLTPHTLKPFATLEEAETRAATETRNKLPAFGAHVRDSFGRDLALYRQGEKVTP